MNAPLPAIQIDRSKFLGGSDVAAIFGVSPWKTSYDLWVDKCTPRESDQALDPEREKFFRRRKRQEPVIAEMLAEEYGIEVTRLSLDSDPNRYIDPEHPFLRAEVDFEFLMSPAVRAAFPERADFAAIPDGTLLNGEIKTVHPFKASEWGESGSEEVPIHYAAQVMHGLGVTNRPAALVAALFGLDNLVCFPVMRDDETIAAMREKAVHFWTVNVQQGVAPEPVNVGDVKAMYAAFSGRPAEISEDAFDALQTLTRLREDAKAIKDQQYDCEWRIARSVAFNWGVEVVADPKAQKVDTPEKDNALLLYGGVQVGSWNRQRGTYLDQKRLAAEKPDVVEAYTVEHQYRVFRQKKGKSK